ncbi:hypothetical protein, conserved [Plasmodium vivax]|nr:hypothetical protein, conserved [Plasmodium vivax]
MDKIINNFSVFFHEYNSLFDKNFYENTNIYDEQCKKPSSIYPVTSFSLSTDCIKCMKYLKHLDDGFRDDDHKKQGIIYLYLWLYNYEKKNSIFNGSTKSNLKKIMKLYEDISDPDANIHNVHGNHMEVILNDKLNDLFYLYKKLDNFQNNSECTNKCNCAQECVDTYKQSLEKCNNYGNAYLCNELEKFREKYNNDKPFQAECPNVDSYLPYKNFSTSVIILISFITISVVSSLFFILYKFTPFGSCVGFRSKRPQRIYSNFTNEEANLLYTSGRNRTPEAKPYNIAYNSI